MINNNNDGNKIRVRYKSNEMRKEMRYLSYRESQIVNKLRTEHINLNDYKYVRFDDRDALEGYCRYCDRVETVEHFLEDCFD